MSGTTELRQLETAPTIAVTMGDVAGIGPELIVRALAQRGVRESCQPVVIGDPDVIAAQAERLGSPLRVRVIDDASDVGNEPGELDVLSVDGIDVRGVEVGAVDARAGAAAGRCLEIAMQLALDERVDGIVSAPLSKQALRVAGYDYIDELAFLARISGAARPLLFGVAGSIWTVAVALHVPLADVPRLITEERVFHHIEALHLLLSILLSRQPKIAVAALNPHAGEGGCLGREEIESIEPAVRAARAAGIDVRGPLGADTVFPQALTEHDDGVVCMYHDQMNIFRKLNGRSACATIFSGLPAPVTTTAHGTAYDIAGKGRADPSGLINAISYAVLLSRTPALHS